MNKSYLEKLYKDYCNAVRGKITETIDINDKDFNDWLEVLKNNCNKYTEYIKNYLIKKKININPDIENLFDIKSNAKSIIELYKGFYDTTSAIGTVVVSPHASTLKKQNMDFEISDNIPKIVMGNIKKDIEVIPTFISHNENRNVIKKLEDAYRLGYRILYGVFGSYNDKNQDEKISQVIALQDVLSLDGLVEFYRDSDIYYCTIRSNEKIKIRK